MSTYIGAFHTYGLLLTEKLAALLLENAKKNWNFTKPDSYEEIKDYEEPLEFISHAHYTMQHLSGHFVCIQLPVPSIRPGNALKHVYYS